MSRSRENLQKQKKQEEKMLEQIRSRKVPRVTYEERKKQLAIPNRLNMGGSVEE